MEFIETSIFTCQINGLIPDDDYRQLQAELIQNPERGGLIPDGGGFRKLRFSRPGKGKRGGIRVICYWIAQDHQIWMLLAYAKAKQENLSAAQLSELRALVKEL